MTVLAQDDFDRANGGLGADWSGGGGDSIIIVGAEALAESYNECNAHYNAVSFPDDQWAEVVIGSVATGGGGQGIGPAVRRTTFENLYFFTANDGDFRVYKRVGGSYTQLGETTVSALVEGDVLRLEVEGTTLTATLNETPVCATPVTDSDLSSGSAGMRGWEASGPVGAASWSGGDFDGGGITGALDVTLADATLSSAGVSSIEGALSRTLADATLTSTGTSSIEGSLAATLADATLSSAGSSAIEGALSSTLADATLSAAGVSSIVGSLSVTLDDATLSAHDPTPVVASSATRAVRPRFPFGF